MNNGDMNNLNNVGGVPTTNTNTTPVAPQEAQGIVLPNSQPVLGQPGTAVVTEQPATTAVETTPVAEPAKTEEENKKKQKKSAPNPNGGGGISSLTVLLFLAVVGLGVYVFYSNSLYKSNLDHLKYNCTPVSSYQEDKKLELDSTIVVELYNKVKTSIREDYSQPDFNDTMKLYLAFRQIPDSKFYSSNCNMFKNTTMEPYTCGQGFTPKAFKVEDLEHEIKVLFGEETKIPLANIKLQNACVGGYAYIPERGEFVEGKCDVNTAVSYKAEKKLIDAYTNRNTVTLVEDVKYIESEKLKLPDYLKDGTYYYTFRLDMNYNYVLISKTYESKY